jgi:hypothetical protein
VVDSTLTTAYFKFVAALRQKTNSPLSFDNNFRRQFEKSFQNPEAAQMLNQVGKLLRKQTNQSY